MRLYFSYFSPPARAALMVAKMLDLPVEVKNCNILCNNYMTPELVKVNPQRCVPTLIDEDLVLWDSHAIAAYLVNNYGKDTLLYPSNPKEKAVVDQRLHFDTGVLYPTVYDLICPLLLKQHFMIPQKTASKVKKAYGFLEKFLERSRWLAGDNVTIADICCIPNITSMDFILPIDGRDFPRLKRYARRGQKLPHYMEVNQIGLDKLGFKLLEILVQGRQKDVSSRSSALFDRIN